MLELVIDRQGSMLGGAVLVLVEQFLRQKSGRLLQEERSAGRKGFGLSDLGQNHTRTV